MDKCLEIISKAIFEEGFQINESKLTYYQPGDEAIITGLKICSDGTLVPQQDLLDSIERNIIKLQSLRSTYQNCRALGFKDNNSKSRYKKLKGSVSGQIRFVERVLGEDHDTIRVLHKHFMEATTTDNYIEQHFYI